MERGEWFTTQCEMPYDGTSLQQGAREGSGHECVLVLFSYIHSFIHILMHSYINSHIQSFIH